MSQFSQIWGPLEPWKECHLFDYKIIQIFIKQAICNPILYLALINKWAENDMFESECFCNVAYTNTKTNYSYKFWLGFDSILGQGRLFKTNFNDT